jgi:2-oxoglutarate dehydrogenase complex dehydrogenase (E1) component-like enzyme
MAKKLDNLDIESIVSKMLIDNKSSVIDSMARQYINTISFKETVAEVLRESTESAIFHKISHVSDYFTQQFSKHFSDHLTSVTDQQIKLHIDTNPKFKKLFNKGLTEYLEKMNFEKTMMEFFDTKKDLLMELMLRQMFQDKNIKDN